MTLCLISDFILVGIEGVEVRAALMDKEISEIPVILD
jgi:FixJ family two-component response regulator